MFVRTYNGHYKELIVLNTLFFYKSLEESPWDGFVMFRGERASSEP